MAHRKTETKAPRPKSPESSKSPLEVTRLALQSARDVLGPYSSHTSRHDFTQAQLFAVLVLRTFLKTDYRGVIRYLADWSDLKQALGLRRLPHHTTLFYAEKRLLKKRPSLPSKAPFWSWLSDPGSWEEYEALQEAERREPLGLILLDLDLKDVA